MSHVRSDVVDASTFESWVVEMLLYRRHTKEIAAIPNVLPAHKGLVMEEHTDNCYNYAGASHQQSACGGIAQ